MVPLEPGQSPDGVIVRDVPSLPAIVPPPMHSCHALQEHRQENQVHADQRRPEMHFSPELAHSSAGRFREPEIDTCKKAEDGAGRYDVMEVRDNVISIVQIKVS